MKISSNFVRPLGQAVMPVACAVWVAALALAAGAVWLIDEATDLRRELPELRARLGRIEARKETAIAQKDLPTSQELAETRTRVAKINAATQSKGLSPPALLNMLEALLPPDAWLISIHHRANRGEAVLIASAASAVPLSAFLLKLEHDPLFEEAMLMREISPAGRNKPTVQFEIRLKVRS